MSRLALRAVALTYVIDCRRRIARNAAYRNPEKTGYATGLKKALDHAEALVIPV
jgi:hypothetical protein